MSGVRMLHFWKIDGNSFKTTNTIYYGFNYNIISLFHCFSDTRSSEWWVRDCNLMNLLQIIVCKYCGYIPRPTLQEGIKLLQGRIQDFYLGGAKDYVRAHAHHKRIRPGSSYWRWDPVTGFLALKTHFDAQKRFWRWNGALEALGFRRALSHANWALFLSILI